ncbi:aspartate--ammonia ligase [Acholeplasma sp. OttesenSCG-928-E16]|nr:aspartate--ammonia ligase [Acholeplasma sp. OttesenSCG-928-E16]
MNIDYSLYKKISIKKKEEIIKFIKDKFEINLAKALKIDRVSAPIMINTSSGLNDDLSGKERKIQFTPLYAKEQVEIVQSLAKWKRKALHDYGYHEGEGIYTDMNAIRQDDQMDEIHSLYVDQWDWEKIINKKNRTIFYLKQVVNRIVSVLAKTNDQLIKKYPIFDYKVTNKCFFIKAETLREKYPNHTPKEREYLITKEYKTVFIIGIGKKLKDKTIHDFRAPDYDDWSLNGDLLLYHDVLDIALEVSSMGIRVDKESLVSQLKEMDLLERLNFPYHQNVLNETYPLSIGGGIGQSRICLLLMQQAHIGEIQASYWSEEEINKQKNKGIILL